MVVSLPKYHIWWQEEFWWTVNFRQGGNISHYNKQTIYLTKVTANDLEFSKNIENQPKKSNKKHSEQKALGLKTINDTYLYNTA